MFTQNDNQAQAGLESFCRNCSVPKQALIIFFGLIEEGARLTEPLFEILKKETKFWSSPNFQNEQLSGSFFEYIASNLNTEHTMYVFERLGLNWKVIYKKCLLTSNDKEKEPVDIKTIMASQKIVCEAVASHKLILSMEEKSDLLWSMFKNHELNDLIGLAKKLFSNDELKTVTLNLISKQKNLGENEDTEDGRKNDLNKSNNLKKLLKFLLYCTPFLDREIIKLLQSFPDLSNLFAADRNLQEYFFELALKSDLGGLDILGIIGWTFSDPKLTENCYLDLVKSKTSAIEKRKKVLGLKDEDLVTLCNSIMLNKHDTDLSNACMVVELFMQSGIRFVALDQKLIWKIITAMVLVKWLIEPEHVFSKQLYDEIKNGNIELICRLDGMLNDNSSYEISSSVKESLTGSCKTVLERLRPMWQDILLCAVEHKHKKIVEHLLKRKLVDVNFCGKDGNTVLHIAARDSLDNRKMLKTLIDFGANPFLVNKEGRISLFVTVNYDNRHYLEEVCVISQREEIEQLRKENVELKNSITPIKVNQMLTSQQENFSAFTSSKKKCSVRFFDMTQQTLKGILALHPKLRKILVSGYIPDAFVSHAGMQMTGNTNLALSTPFVTWKYDENMNAIAVANRALRVIDVFIPGHDVMQLTDAGMDTMQIVSLAVWNNYVYAGGSDGQVRAWSIAGGKPIKNFTPQCLISGENSRSEMVNATGHDVQVFSFADIRYNWLFSVFTNDRKTYFDTRTTDERARIVFSCNFLVKNLKILADNNLLLLDHMNRLFQVINWQMDTRIFTDTKIRASQIVGINSENELILVNTDRDKVLIVDATHFEIKDKKIIPSFINNQSANRMTAPPRPDGKVLIQTACIFGRDHIALGSEQGHIHIFQRCIGTEWMPTMTTQVVGRILALEINEDGSFVSLTSNGVINKWGKNVKLNLDFLQVFRKQLFSIDNHGNQAFMKWNLSRGIRRDDVQISMLGLENHAKQFSEFLGIYLGRRIDILVNSDLSSSTSVWQFRGIQPYEWDAIIQLVAVITRKSVDNEPRPGRQNGEEMVREESVSRQPPLANSARMFPLPTPVRATVVTQQNANGNNVVYPSAPLFTRSSN